MPRGREDPAPAVETRPRQPSWVTRVDCNRWMFPAVRRPASRFSPRQGRVRRARARYHHARALRAWSRSIGVDVTRGLHFW